MGSTWSWIHDRVESWRNIEIPVEPNTEDYPPWTRRPLRPMKECLAIDRRAHSHPNFIDLDCRLQRPFICEKSNEICLMSTLSCFPLQTRYTKIIEIAFGAQAARSTKRSLKDIQKTSFSNSVPFWQDSKRTSGNLCRPNGCGFSNARILCTTPELPGKKPRYTVVCWVPDWRSWRTPTS